MGSAAGWRDALDALEAGIRDLEAVSIPADAASDAALYCSRLERKLWLWRRTVEAAYLDRLTPMPGVLDALAAQTNRSTAEVVVDLIGAKALHMDYARLDRYINRFGLDPSYSEGQNGNEDGSEDEDHESPEADA